MFRKYLLPVAALALFVFAVHHVVTARQPPKEVAPPVEPAHSPFGDSVAGAGVIEARSENIAVGSPLPGVVVEVFVQEGDHVKAGDPLFRLDDRQLQAELKMREATLHSAKAQLERLEREPRAEEVPVREAEVRAAQATLADRADQLTRGRGLHEKGATSEEELVSRRQAYYVAQAQLAQAQAELALLKAGAWKQDVSVARAAVELAQAQADETKTQLDRLLVRALVDGEVLQVNVRPGEFVGAPPGEPLIVLGDVEQLHVRVDIDEHDIPRFRPGAPAKASLKGDLQEQFPLTFVRVEPYVIPKKSLTGDNTERVDTRVLQVIYAIDTRDRRLYVGQQLDVFIDVGATAVAGS